MRKLPLIIAAVLVAGAASAPRAGDTSKKECPMPPPASKELARVKKLAGTWKGGPVVMEGKKMVPTSVFRVTAAGSAVVETMAPGTPQEMVNMYHDVGGRLVMTHYCAMGNAPEMRLVNSDDKSLSFEAVEGNGIDPKKDAHMHGLVLLMTDKDHYSATWTAKGVEEKGPSVFSYTRAAK